MWRTLHCSFLNCVVRQRVPPKSRSCGVAAAGRSGPSNSLLGGRALARRGSGAKHNRHRGTSATARRPANSHHVTIFVCIMRSRMRGVPRTARAINLAPCQGIPRELGWHHSGSASGRVEKVGFRRSRQDQGWKRHWCRFKLAPAG
jgi:hypothetical protein